SGRSRRGHRPLAARRRGRRAGRVDARAGRPARALLREARSTRPRGRPGPVTTEEPMKTATMRVLVCTLLCCVVSIPAHAVEVSGVRFADTTVVDGARITVNRLGGRRA